MRAIVPSNPSTQTPAVARGDRAGPEPADRPRRSGWCADRSGRRRSRARSPRPRRARRRRGPRPAPLVAPPAAGGGCARAPCASAGIDARERGRDAARRAGVPRPGRRSPTHSAPAPAARSVGVAPVAKVRRRSMRPGVHARDRLAVDVDRPDRALADRDRARRPVPTLTRRSTPPVRASSGRALRRPACGALRLVARRRGAPRRATRERRDAAASGERPRGAGGAAATAAGRSGRAARGRARRLRRGCRPAAGAAGCPARAPAPRPASAARRRTPSSASAWRPER